MSEAGQNNLHREGLPDDLNEATVSICLKLRDLKLCAEKMTNSKDFPSGWMDVKLPYSVAHRLERLFTDAVIQTEKAWHTWQDEKQALAAGREVYAIGAMETDDGFFDGPFPALEVALRRTPTLPSKVSDTFLYRLRGPGTIPEKLYIWCVSTHSWKPCQKGEDSK